MAKSTNVVDQSALYNAAYNQGLDAECFRVGDG